MYYFNELYRIPEKIGEIKQGILQKTIGGSFVGYNTPHE